MRVVFYKPSSLSGMLISWWTRSKYCHCSIVANGIEWETTKKYGVRGIDPRWHGDSIEINEPIAELKVAEYCENKLGTRYGITNILRFFFPWVHENKRRKICSTLVWSALKNAGLLPEPEDVVSPGQVYNASKIVSFYLKKNG